MNWLIYCRVIDNFGDIGVCWRLASALAKRGNSVQLVSDDLHALSWMAPLGQLHVEVSLWPGEPALACAAADVVIEAFGCDLPAGAIAAMQQSARPPVWINLEYLSAEPYVERSHGLASPQLSGPGAGLTKWFFYPGFTLHTGGLMYEFSPQENQKQWLQAHAIAPHLGERLVSLFCYPQAPIAELLTHLTDAPTLVLAMAHVGIPAFSHPHVRIQRLPYLSQVDYDQLLQCCDLNIVRGEDSFVRAQWAAKPFIWHIYPQSDGAHLHKLQAFLARYLQGMPTQAAHQISALWRHWNCSAPHHTALPQQAPWTQHCQQWQTHLQMQPDLVDSLIGFAAKHAKL
jgi:uncharacterized repeat protein (TIGR03837 family)